MSTLEEIESEYEDDSASGSLYSDDLDDHAVTDNPADGESSLPDATESQDHDGTSSTDEQSHLGSCISAWKQFPTFDKKLLKTRSKEVRLRGHFSHQYRMLYNSIIESVLNPSLDESDVFLEPSDIGCSSWSSREKTLLFSNLQTLGRGESKQLADRIETKTEPEVRAYIELLTQGSLEDHIKSQRYFGVALDEIPAAFEVGPTCEAQLDLTAENLAHKVEKSDIKREKKRHGEYWLLDTKVAEMIEKQMHTMPSTPAQADGMQIDESDFIVPQLPVQAASLLHLGNWLELAKLFMSSSADHKSSWVDLIESNEERPSIFNTAFSDFHNLAVSLTKRLARASLFQAMSRLRATDRNNPEQVVRHQDVQAACRMMGLYDWHSYWVKMPRRNRLNVFTRGKEAGPATESSERGRTHVSYERVEHFLRSSAEGESSEPEDDGGDTTVPIEMEVNNSDSDSATSYDSDLWTDASASDHDNDHKLASAAPERASPGTDFKHGADPDDSSDDDPAYDFDKAETAYLEALDQEAGKQEQNRLWAILKHKPVLAEPKGEDLDLPAPPPRKRKQLEEIEDWRSKVEWRPEWEEFQIIPDAEQFAAMGRRGAERKRRRLEKYGRANRS